MEAPTFEVLDEMAKAIRARLIGRTDEWEVIDEAARMAYRLAAADALHVFREAARASVQSPQDQAPPWTDCTAHTAIAD